MRRIILQPGEQFTNAHLKRTGAFNAQALTAATAIIEGVRERGDEALRAYTEQFDGVRVEEFRVSQAAIAEAIVNVDDKTARALRQAAAQIRDFHERQKQQGWFTVREDGALVGSKVEPLESVGIYVPGGRALYPSTVLMNALPAALELAAKYQVEMPIVQTVNAVVNKGMSAAEAVRSLMDRDPKNELPQSYEK